MLPIPQSMYIEPEKKPTLPPYKPVSPFVKEYFEGKAKATMAPSSYRSYRTTLPEPVFGLPKMIVTPKVDEKSIHSTKSHTSESSHHTYPSKVLREHKKPKMNSDSKGSYRSFCQKDDDGDDSMHSNSETSYFRSHRMKPCKLRPKFEKVQWDGMHSFFRTFRKAIEGHLLQVGAGYLIDQSFIELYAKLGKNYLKSDVF